MHAGDFYILARSHKKRRAEDSVHHSAIMHDQSSWEYTPYCAVGMVREMARLDDIELTDGTLAFIDAHTEAALQPTLPLW